MIQSGAAERMPLGGWRLVVIAAAYLAGLVLIANLAFGRGTMFSGKSADPTRTGAYGSRLPLVAPVDPGSIGKAIIEAAGGAPTIARAMGAPDKVAETTTTAQSVAYRTGSSRTNPTYTAVVRTSTTPNWSSLLTLIPTNLQFPPKGSPHRH